MKHTSFELAKQVYDKGVRIETHFDTDPADGTIYSKEEIIEFGIDATDFIPSPTLCEWLERLPISLEINNAWHYLVMKRAITGTWLFYYQQCGDSKTLQGFSDKNPCDACAQLALWLLDNKLIGGE